MSSSNVKKKMIAQKPINNKQPLATPNSFDFFLLP